MPSPLWELADVKRGRDGRHRRVRECGRLCLSRHGERALCRPDIRACCLRSGRRRLEQRRPLQARTGGRERGRDGRHRRVRECRCLRFPIRLLLDLTGFASYFILTLQPRCVTVAARSRVWLLTSAPRSSTCQENRSLTPSALCCCCAGTPLTVGLQRARVAAKERAVC
jgi:hypothetical protein